MRRVTALLSAAAVVLFMATTFAQAPTLTGTWTRDAGAAPAGGGGGGAAGGGGGGGQRGGGGGGGGAFNCGMECTIVQDAKTVTIKHTAGPNGQAAPDTILNLTGDTKISTPGRNGGAPTDSTVTAKVDGGKWVLTSTRDMGGTSVTSTQTISVAGGKLTISSTNSARADQPPTVQTYSKK